jgi:hypothetical protein
MKLSLRYYFVFIFTLLSTTILAQSISIGGGENSEQVMDLSEQGFTLNLKVNTIQFIKVKHDKEFFYQASIPSFGKSLTIGDPQLPVYKRLIEIPANAHYHIEIRKMHFEVYNLDDYQIKNYLFPYQESVEKREDAVIHFQLNKTTYQKDAFYSNALYSIEELGEMRGVHIARLNISPVEYNPVKNQLKVYDEIEIRVVFDLPEGITTQKQTALYSPAFDVVKGQLLNAKPYAVSPANLVQYPFKYVIVADSSFRQSLAPFIRWKEKQGYKIIEAYTSDTAVGNTNASIKAYLKSLYLAGTANDPAPSFVLFVGDVTQIPKYSGMYNSWAADLYYCEFTNDYFPEMMYGRFSANDTSQLNPQIQKTIEYEKYLMADPSFLDTSILISGKDASYAPTYGDGQINYGTNNYFNTSNGIVCKSYLYVNQSYIKDLEIRQNADSGAAFINYTAHGRIDGWHDPRFKVVDVANMQNAGKYPFMVGNACLTNKFDAPVCFGEALLRARNKGAIGYIGASYNTLWDEDYYWAVGFGTISSNPSYSSTTSGLYDLIFHTHNEPFSQQALTAYQYMQAGNLAVTQGGSNVRRYWELYHLMGDPSLMPYLKVPSPLTATYSPLLPLGINYFDITTEPYALVAISRNDSLISSTLADSTGLATLYFTPFTQAGLVDIVITASQKQPFFGLTMAAQPTGPYVIYYDHLIIDSTENNNGRAEYGEHIQLDMSMINITSFSADSSYAKLSTTDTMVSISDSLSFIGTINGNDTIAFDTLFAFNVSPSAVDKHDVRFELYVEDSLGAHWTTHFYVPLYAPNIVIGNAHIDDSQYGNGNGRIDAGETVHMLIELHNTGSISATDINSSLTTNYSGVSIGNSTHFLDTLKSDSLRFAEFEITVGSGFIVGDIIKFDYSFTSKSYLGNHEFTQLVGQVDEDFETGDFSKFIWKSSNANNWQIESSVVYEGAYSSRSHAIGDNDTSSILITLNVLTDDSISFYQKVSSEETYDVLAFYIDDKHQDRWSGLKPWQYEQFAVKKGIHTLRWSYLKDAYAADTNYDAGFLDMIIFPPTDAWTNVENAEEQLLNIKLMPNPTSGFTTLSFNIEDDTKADIILYDIKGQLVKVIQSDMMLRGGNQQVKIDAQNLKSGIYFIGIQSGDKRWFKKLIVL